MAGNWITDIINGTSSMLLSSVSPIMSAGGTGSSPTAGLDPALAGILSSLGPQAPADDSSSTTKSPPTLQQLLMQSALETDSRYAFTGNTPALVSQTYKLGKRAELQDGDYLVFMGDAPVKKDTHKVQETYAPGPYAGGHTVSEPGTPDTVTTKKDQGDKVLTASQAVDLPYLWDQDKITNAIKRMQDAGLEVNTFDDMVGVWQGLVQRASKSYTLSGGKMQMTPWDALDLYKSESGGDAAGSQGFTGSRTTVARNVTELSDGQSWSVLQSTLQKMLGRDPSDEELRNFTYKMSQQAAHNPSITKTIAHYKDGQLTRTNSHTNPGFTMDDAVEAAYNRAQNNPDYGEYQAATTYFNAALSALGPIGG